jgi:hypothetical protein
MRHVLANFALIFGFIGFIGYLFLIIAGFFGCCTGMTTDLFHKVVIIILITAVVLFALCMYNNCCKNRRTSNTEEKTEE